MFTAEHHFTGPNPTRTTTSEECNQYWISQRCVVEPISAGFVQEIGSIDNSRRAENQRQKLNKERQHHPVHYRQGRNVERRRETNPVRPETLQASLMAFVDMCMGCTWYRSSCECSSICTGRPSNVTEHPYLGNATIWISQDALKRSHITALFCPARGCLR
jgi:hypothetical protein